MRRAARRLPPARRPPQRLPAIACPPILPGETRADWLERIRGSVTEVTDALDVKAAPYDPERWADVRHPEGA